MEDRDPDKLGHWGPDPETDEPVEDFAALFEATQARRGKSIEKDAKVEGTVVSIGQEWLFVDIGAKSEGVIAREELTDKEGRLTVKAGDLIRAYVVNMTGGEILLSVKMTAAASEEAIRGASRSGVPVEGLVMGERKGGYTVKVFGRDAFCPYSQMDLRPGGGPEDYLNQRFAFRITQYSDGGRNIVLSRREILEEERAKQVAHLKETLAPGDLIEGTVRKVTDFGVFVDIGGIEGLIPMSELAWHRVSEASEILRANERVTVKVMDLDWENRRISLSHRQTLQDPWDLAPDKFPVGKTLVGTVKKLMNFGAFVELEPGIEGLIHISNMGMGRRINHPREAVHEGEEVEVNILTMDQQARRIGLELSLAASLSTESISRMLQKGDIVSGTVDSVKDYGVFVALPDGRVGLLHVSEIDEGRRGDLKKRFPVGSSVEVEVLDIDPGSSKISLSARTLSKKNEDAQFKDFVSGRGTGASFGTLGDLLKNKLKG